MAKFKPQKEKKKQEVAITVRLPEDLHKRLDKYAKKENFKTLNKLVLQMIEHCLNENNA